MPDPKQPCSPHGWTLDTLEKYLSEQLTTLKDSVRDQDARNLERFAAAKEAVNAALAAADKALAKAESASERRFEALNELRAMATDQTNRFMPREEYNVAHQAVVEKCNSNAAKILALETSQLTKREGATMGINVLAMVAALIGASLGTIIGHFIR